MGRYNMPARYLHDLISGAEMDLTVNSYANFDRLREYCYRGRRTVGPHHAASLRLRDSRALDLAEKNRLAFQLTNIIRGSSRRLAMRRVYCRTKISRPYNVSPEDFARTSPHSASAETPALRGRPRRAMLDEGAALFLTLIAPESSPAPCG